MKRRALLALYVYAGVIMATGYLGQAQVQDVTPVTDAMLQDPAPADWLSWRRAPDGWGYSPLEQIDRSNVDELRLAWSWGFEPGVSQTTQIVHDGVMYVANPGNVVQALDARTGDFICCRFVNSWKGDGDNEEFKRLLALVQGESGTPPLGAVRTSPTEGDISLMAKPLRSATRLADPA